MSCFINDLKLNHIKNYPVVEVILIIVLSISSACLIIASLSIASLFIDECMVISLEAVLAGVQILLHPFFLFICPISPFSVVIITILIKNLTVNKLLVEILSKVPKMQKLLITMTLLLLLLNIAVVSVFCFQIFSFNIKLLMLILLLAGYVFYFSFVITFLLDKFILKLKNTCLLNKLRRVINQYFNNLFTQLLPIFAPVLGYWLCYVYWGLSEEITFYCITPFLIFLIFYILLSNAQKLNDLIRYLYRHIVYVLISFGAGLYYINHSVILSITSTNDTPAPMTYVVKFAMIIIALVMIFRLPLYKLYQRSKQLYKEVEEDYTKSSGKIVK